MMGLAYPGGPEIEKLARDGDEKRFNFTVPLLDNRIAFSYSGLKNAVRVEITKLGELTVQDRADLSASFQRVAVEHLLHKLNMIFRSSPPKTFAIVSGAAANGYLREKIAKLCDKYGATLILPQLKYCSDNAAMIGRLGIDMYALGLTIPYDKIAIVAINSKSNF